MPAGTLRVLLYPIGYYYTNLNIGVATWAEAVNPSAAQTQGSSNSTDGIVRAGSGFFNPDYDSYQAHFWFDTTNYVTTISNATLSLSPYDSGIVAGQVRFADQTPAGTYGAFSGDTHVNRTFVDNGSTPWFGSAVTTTAGSTARVNFTATSFTITAARLDLVGVDYGRMSVNGASGGAAPTTDQTNVYFSTPTSFAGTATDPYLAFDLTTTDSQSFTNSGAVESFVVPANTTLVQLEAWGGGGAGGGNTGQEPGGGGGGYARSIIATTPGETLYIRVGRGGTNSTATAATRDGVSSRVSRNADGITSPLVRAGAGQGGNATTAGSGGGNAVGTDGTSSGDVTFIGGNGAAAQGGGGSRAGSGGGSSAGHSAIGTNGTAGSGTTVGVGGTAPTGGGNGGNGGAAASGTGVAGTIPGGGGGGKGSSGTSGGAGARGQVILSWTPDAAQTSAPRWGINVIYAN